MIEEFHESAVRIAQLLRQREQKIAVADGATGGLISASLLTVPGALDFYVGGGVVYSAKARDVLYGLEPDAFDGMQSATPKYALAQARAIRTNFGAHWGIAESGAAGGSKHPSGVASGRTCVAIAGPLGQDTVQASETKSDNRMGNMLAFTRNALALLEKAIASAR